jgi:hypothetical protein
MAQKALSQKDPPKTLGTRASNKTGTGLGGQRARQASFLDMCKSTQRTWSG